MSPMTNSDEWRNALDGMEHRIERQMRILTQPIADDLKEVKALQQTANGRIGRLEEDRVRRDTEDRVRAELAKTAVQDAATKAARAVRLHDDEVLARETAREWSSRKWGLLIALGSLLVATISFVASVVAHGVTSAH